MSPRFSIFPTAAYIMRSSSNEADQYGYSWSLWMGCSDMGWICPECPEELNEVYTLIAFTVHWTSHTNSLMVVNSKIAVVPYFCRVINMYSLYICWSVCSNRSWWNCFKGVQYLTKILCLELLGSRFHRHQFVPILEFRELRHRIDRFSPDGNGCPPPRWYWKMCHHFNQIRRIT